MVNNYGPIFDAAAREWNVDPYLLRAVATQESGGNPTARSRAGAVGVMQIMPATGSELGVTDLTDPEQSIYAGAKYLSRMLDRYGHPELALAAYNAGPGRVDTFMRGGALPAETMAYVPAVRGHYERLRPVADRRPSALPSDADFLKGLPGAAPARAMSDEDFLKSLPGAAAVPAVAQAPQPTPQERYGARADVGGPVMDASALAAVPSAVGRVGAAAVQGFQEGAQQPPPLVTPLMERLGVYPPAQGGGTVLQGMNKLLIDPIAQAGEWAVRGVGGLFRGAQAGVAQAGEEVGQPQLGRDLAAMPEAFMGGTPFMRPPAANRLAPRAAEPTPAPLPAPAPPVVPAPDFLPPGVQRPPAPSPVPSAPPEFLPPGVRVAEPAEAGARRSVGAAATPDPLANITRKEMVAQRATAERDRLMEPQPAGADTTQYIPGVQTTEAQYMQRAGVARDEKRLEMEMPEPFKEVRRQNNEVRAQFYADMEGTPVLKRRLEEARDAQATADLRAAWSGKQPANVQPVQDTAAAILESPDGRRPAVRSAVDQVTKELVGTDGKAITDPELLYGVRKHIDDLLEAKDGSGTKINDRVRAQLLELKGSLDGVIEQAAPGFGQYLKNFTEASKPIDEMTILQEYAPKIRDTQGRITYSGVQRMMKDIVTAREGKATHPAQGISDDAMAKLWALRDDLRRVASAEDLAKARGSDTAQNFLDVAKSVGGRAAGETAGLMASGVPGGSLVYGAINSVIRQNKLKRDVSRALNPDINKLTPPAP